jgi:NTP pyrophosphatase (non-canonical NTP hydrolase)
MPNYKFQDDYPVDDIDYSGFSQYQDFTATTDKAGTNLNSALGMAGEVGEIFGKVLPLVFTDQVPDVKEVIGDITVAGLLAEKLKKRTRVDHLEAISFDKLNSFERAALANEVADVIWYLARFSARLGEDLGEIMRRNVEKLSSRKTRGVLHGKGDER